MPREMIPFLMMFYNKETVMTREETQAAIAALEEHATSLNEMRLINYLKLNLSNLFRLEDQEGSSENLSIGDHVIVDDDYQAMVVDLKNGMVGVEDQDGDYFQVLARKVKLDA
jgi:hypothetical protein